MLYIAKFLELLFAFIIGCIVASIYISNSTLHSTAKNTTQTKSIPPLYADLLPFDYTASVVQTLRTSYIITGTIQSVTTTQKGKEIYVAEGATQPPVGPLFIPTNTNIIQLNSSTSASIETIQKNKGTTIIYTINKSKKDGTSTQISSMVLH